MGAKAIMLQGTGSDVAKTADGFRGKFLEKLGVKSGCIDYRAGVEQELDDIAAELEIHLDCDAPFALAR